MMISRKYKLLICDDEQEIIDLLKLYFDATLYELFPANNGLDGWELIKTHEIDLAMIDVMMPNMNGLQLIEKIRQVHPSMPILILSALDSIGDKLKGYDIGADDYITKPFEPLEVLAKVKSRLKVIEARQTIEINNLSLDLFECRIRVDGQETDLTQVEFDVLKLFMESPQRVFTKEQIYKAGWKEEYYTNENSIRVIINRIRTIIGSDRIETIRGLGYRLKV